MQTKVVNSLFGELVVDGGRNFAAGAEVVPPIRSIQLLPSLRRLSERASRGGSRMKSAE